MQLRIARTVNGKIGLLIVVAAVVKAVVEIDCFFLHQICIGRFLLCIVTLGIASLWVIPYYNAARAKFYQDLKAKYENQ